MDTEKEIEGLKTYRVFLLGDVMHIISMTEKEMKYILENIGNPTSVIGYVFKGKQVYIPSRSIVYFLEE